MKTSTLRAFKAHVSLWKFFAALLLAWICVPMSQASAQTRGTLKAYWKFSRPDGTHGQLNLFCAASGTEGNEITDWANPGWQQTGAFHQKEIETVVIEESFKNAFPTSCLKWFDGCAYLTEIKGIEYLNTENVTNMSEMFYGCTILPNIDLTHFKTAKVEDMSYMFYGCTALTSLDVSSFNTENVTTTEGMFSLCWGLTKLDLRNFHTWSLTNTHAMFMGCKELQSIYAHDWTSKRLTTEFGGKSDDMFLGCTNLVGEAAYNESKTDATMANAQTGYFMPNFSDGNLNVTYFEKDEKNRIVLNLYNADPFVVSMEHHIYKGTYTRQNMPSTWGTVCVPFIIDVKKDAGTNCEIYKFHKVEGENLFIEKVEEGEIAAGTPVIVRGTKGTDLKVCSPEGNQQIVTEPFTGTETSHIKGTFVEQQLKGTSNYFIAKDKFWQVSGYDKVGNTIAGVIVPPFRATITTESTQAQSLGIVVVDETNSIDQTPTVDNLLSDKAEYFDLQGRRLDGPQKGINLVRMGGKTRKVVIK